jgi:hypothetical protein
VHQRPSFAAWGRLPGQSKGIGVAPSPEYVADFFASSNGLALATAFVAIKNAKLRRRIVDLVEELAEQ